MTLRPGCLACVLALAACHASAAVHEGPREPPTSEAPTSEAPTGEASTGETPPQVLDEGESSRHRAELETRFVLALTAFDDGAYEDAAQLFAQTLLQVPPDPSGDPLRHLLVQHIAWSLLGAYDVSGDADPLDAGEAMLERYLVRHELLLPLAHGEREQIYALLGEFVSRRAGEPPANVHAELVALTDATARSLERPQPRARQRGEDDMVREIEVDTVDWARLDDPEVQTFMRDNRYTGVSVFWNGGEPHNEARVLVRGWVSMREFKAAGRLAFASLREARPALERCYEQALGRGANLLERVEIDLSWSDGALRETKFAEGSRFDATSQACVAEALREAEVEPEGKAAKGQARARLQLSFFVQPERWPDLADYAREYGLASPKGPGFASGGATSEDVTGAPLVPE